jgi:hypothetical protein
MNVNMELVSLPNEVLRQIFLYDSIDIKSLINVMSTCHRLYNVIRNSNELWKQKFKKRYIKACFLYFLFIAFILLAFLVV